MSRRSQGVTQKVAATKSRNFRTFLLMEQFAAEEIAARIRQARKERGLTQEQLAEMCSFSKRSLQDYENGVTIPYRHLRELGQILGRKPEWFLHGEPEAKPEWEERLDRIEEQLAEIRGIVAGLGEDNPPEEEAV